VGARLRRGDSAAAAARLAALAREFAQHERDEEVLLARIEEEATRRAEG